jgi:hypothetical protein
MLQMLYDIYNIGDFLRRFVMTFLLPSVFLRFPIAYLFV